MSSYNTIKIKKYSDVIEEYEAKSAITPGMVLQLNSDDTVQKHSTSGGNAVPYVALEDELQGKGINDNYAAADKVQVWVPNRGDIAYLLLADEQTIAIGDYVMSNGFGKVTKMVNESWESADAQAANTLYDKVIIGQAVEAVDLSTLPEGSESSAAGDYYNPRIKIRIV